MKQNYCRFTGIKTLAVFALVCSMLSLVAPKAFATDPKWYAVQVSAAVQSSPAQVKLTWPVDSNSQGYTIARKAPGASSWTTVGTVAGNVGTYTDASVSSGASYEYQVSCKTPWNYSGYGYVQAGINAPLVDLRGKLLLVVDNTYASSLATELARLQQDLVGDGWAVVRKDVSRNDSVTSVKNVIKSEYNADPNNLKMVFLFGRVPVPYSGNFGPDAHPDHQGAWPADTYYADLDGNWTDSSVNNTSSPRTQTKNVPGDGKFDQSDLPSSVDLQVGRVDLSNMTAIRNKTGQTELDLLRQYLNKDHNFRHRKFNLQRRGLICDNFGESGGESYASSGWRGFSAFFGANNVTQVGNSQYFPTLGSQDYLWSYGCGGGSYTTCYGIGATEDFATTDMKSVFTMYLGSYFGDWDAESNFMRGALATKTYGLASMWSGRPHWFIHPMGLGETLGYVTKLSQNNGTGSTYQQGNWGSRQVHVALMGDPSLRMHPVIPPSNLTVNGSTLTWSASTDSDLQGYHVYRATSANGPFTRVTSSPVTSTSYTDNAAAGTYTYMVRAIKLERSGSGTYYNASQGAFANGTSSGGGTTPVVTVPTMPTTLVASAVSSNQINLTWADTASNESGFKIERKTGSGGSYAQIGTVGSNVTSYSNTGLSAATQYFYRVRAYNSAGDSAYSAESNATTLANTSTPVPTPTPEPPTGATYAKLITTDTATRGSWKNVYGKEGYLVLGSGSSYPSYAQLMPSGKADWTWNSSTTDTRALQKPGTATDRVAGCWYSSGTFNIDLNFTDGKAHRVSFYCLDWDNNSRVQTFQIIDAVTGATLNTQSVSGFGSGKHVVFEIKGSVKVKVTRNAGYNSVISGIFFDAAGTTAEPVPAPTPEPVVIATPAIAPNGGTFTTSVSVTLSTTTSGATLRYTTNGSTPTSASPVYSAPFVLSNTATVKAVAFASGTNSAVATATFTKAVVVEPTPEPTPAPTNSNPNQVVFVSTDTTTKGNWKGVYGSEGYNVIGNTASYPSYAKVTTSGSSAWTWSSSTSDTRALQKGGTATDRIAGCWYSVTGFTIDVNLTDGKFHRVALYCMDWDRNNRAQTIDVLDAKTGAVLKTQSVSGFGDGKYLVFDVKGNVKFRFTRNSGYNAVASGLFFGPSPAM